MIMEWLDLYRINISVNRFLWGETQTLESRINRGVRVYWFIFIRSFQWQTISGFCIGNAKYVCIWTVVVFYSDFNYDNTLSLSLILNKRLGCFCVSKSNVDPSDVHCLQRISPPTSGQFLTRPLIPQNFTISSLRLCFFLWFQSISGHHCFVLLVACPSPFCFT